MFSAPPGAGPRRAAFTLLEVLAVLSIVAILAGLVLGAGRQAAEAGKVARAKAELAVLSAALENFRRIYGDYPQALSDSLAADTTSGQFLYAALNGQRGPALGSIAFTARQHVLLEKAKFVLGVPTATDTAANYMADPWGNPYHYAYNPAAAGWKNPSFVLLSAGPDGRATLPIPGDGRISAAYESARQNGQLVNTDNLYANRY